MAAGQRRALAGERGERDDSGRRGHAGDRLLRAHGARLEGLRVNTRDRAARVPRDPNCAVGVGDLGSRCGNVDDVLDPAVRSELPQQTARLRCRPCRAASDRQAADLLAQTNARADAFGARVEPRHYARVRRSDPDGTTVADDLSRSRDAKAMFELPVARNTIDGRLPACYPE